MSLRVTTCSLSQNDVSIVRDMWNLVLTSFQKRNRFIINSENAGSWLSVYHMYEELPETICHTFISVNNKVTYLDGCSRTASNTSNGSTPGHIAPACNRTRDTHTFTKILRRAAKRIPTRIRISDD